MTHRSKSLITRNARCMCMCGWKTGNAHVCMSIMGLLMIVTMYYEGNCSTRNPLITSRNEVGPKYFQKHVSRILSTGGRRGSASVHAGIHPPDQPGRHPPGPARQIPPGPARQTPPDQPGRHIPPGPARQTPPPPDQADPLPGSRLQHTVNERPVRILLECILVDRVNFKIHTHTHTSSRFGTHPKMELTMPRVVVPGPYMNLMLPWSKTKDCTVYFKTIFQKCITVL